MRAVVAADPEYGYSKDDWAKSLLDKYGGDSYSDLVGYTADPDKFLGIGTGQSVTNTYIPLANSANTVNANTVTSESIFGDYDRYLELLKEISDSNTAKSIELAKEQNTWQAEQNKIAMDFNAVEAQKQRDWQQYLSDTAHQREVSDLIAAGLNPILSASGSGAPIGSGAAAQGVTSAGARGSVDDTYGTAVLAFLNNTMDFAMKMAVSANSASNARADAYLEGRKYAADMQYKIAQDFPSNGWRFADSVMNSIASAAGYDSWTDMTGKLISKVLPTNKKTGSFRYDLLG